MELQCCCCFETIDLNNAISCSAGHINGHITCTDCLVGGIEVAVGDQKALKCFHESVCDKNYTEKVRMQNLYKHTTKYLLERVYRSLQSLICMAVHFVIIGLLSKMNWRQNLQFSIVSCKTYSCKTCKKERHGGPCDPK
jgi:hypothetical protein